jgi:bifunctional DNA-binding transcriptional regulator/antitoxin component of YhaV-PrlF toxin-antitoxin module
MAGKAGPKNHERTSRVGHGRRVTIPREIFEKLRMREGDVVAVQQRGASVVIKPKTVVDPDDILTQEEGLLLKKAEHEMRTGKYVTLAQLHHDLARKPSRRSRKTA